MIDKPTETFEEKEARLMQSFSYEKEKPKTGVVKNVELKYKNNLISENGLYNR